MERTVQQRPSDGVGAGRRSAAAASSVVNQQQVVSAALAQPVEELQAYVKQQSACNVDETSWRQGEQAKASWLWVVVTALVTVFHIVPSRSGTVARQLSGIPTPG